MAINTDLLVAAPMLQNYLVNKDTGAPLSGGIITLWVDSSRYVTYKNWYYQTGTQGNYSWIALDNPLTLSSAGTIQDPNGNDVIPFYYPYEENDENTPQAYFITVYSADSYGQPDVLQFTRENFPFQGSNSSPESSTPTLRNYIVNNIYWRNIGSLDCQNVTNQIIAPSQHDGYTNGDIRFIKDITGANDDLIFSEMTEVLENDITPEYYLNVSCSGVQNGETVKCIQYPVSLHIDTLQNVPATFVFHGQNVAGNPNNYVDFYIYQFAGTGALIQSDPIFKERIVLSNSWEKQTINFVFPDASGITPGSGGDDALFVRIQYPLSLEFDINHTKPQIYLSSEVPDNDFDTYDQVSAIVSSPRTGDFRSSLNGFYDFGWVICNDGVISNSGSFTPPANVAVARRNIDTWPLFSLLWGLNASATPIYDSSGSLSSRTTAIADWTANKQMQLTLTLGRALLNLPPATNVTYDRSTTPSWGSVAGVFSVSAGTASLFYVGAPVYLTGTMPTSGNFTANVVYYAIPSIDGSSNTQFQLASSYANALAGTAIAAGSASNNGSSIIVNFALGASFGEARHIQLGGEIGAHIHTGNGTINGQNNDSGGLNVVLKASNNGTTSNPTIITTPSAGSSHPFNIIPPVFYGNVFLKL